MDPRNSLISQSMSQIPNVEPDLLHSPGPPPKGSNVVYAEVHQPARVSKHSIYQYMYYWDTNFVRFC